MNKLIVSPSPHVQTRESVPKLMYGVILSLLPALAVSIFYFGIGMIIVTTVSIVSSVLFEYLIQRFVLKTKPSHLDGSAFLTGLIYALSDEIHQSFVPGRDCSLLDLAADTAGLAVGLLVCLSYSRKHGGPA